jgi:hypothetical protein
MGPRARIPPPNRLRARLAAAVALCVAGCALEVRGLEAPDAAPLPAPAVSDAAAPTVSGDDSSLPSSGDDAAMAPIDSAPPPTLLDVGAPDAATDADQGTLNCDLDQDGFKSTKPGCDGTDCCDNDARTHPGEQAFFTAADACGKFDYNCDGTDEPQFAKVNCMLALLACTGSGFDKAPPACGAVATFDACNLGIGCYTSQSQQAQSCR